MIGSLYGAAQCLLGVTRCTRHAAAAEDVVELVEEQGLPDAANRLVRIRGARVQQRQRAGCLGLAERGFGPSIQLLERRNRRIAADGMYFQRLGHGSACRVRHLGEVAFRIAEHQVVSLALQARDHRHVIPRGPAAVIADAVEAHQRQAFARCPLFHHLDLARRRRRGAGCRVVAHRYAKGGDCRPIRRHPVEKRGGQLNLVFLRPHEHVVGISRVAKKHRQGARVAEAVDIVSRGHVHAEAIAEVALAVERLADERLAAGQVAVGLQPPASRDDPAAGAHQIDYLGEESGIQILDPAVDDRFTACKDHPRVVVEQLDGRPAGADGFGTAFGPAPEPDGVQMGVPNHVQAWLAHRSIILPKTCRPEADASWSDLTVRRDKV